MKDILKGLWLVCKHVFYTLSYGVGVKYVEFKDGRAYISDMPFGSQWLTEQSNMWIVRTKSATKALGYTPNGMFICTDVEGSCDAKLIKMKP